MKNRSIGEKKATMILSGATIYAGKGLPDDLDFVAISGNEIVRTGKGPLPEDLAGVGAIVYEFDKDTLITAGFHDNHVHIVLAGMLDKYVSLEGCKSEEEAARKAREFADTIPDEEWVIGFGFSRTEWPDGGLPTKETLDALIPGRPVFLLDCELHSAWANSKAFETAGVNAHTRGPEFGEIDRLSGGEPKGFLYETALALVAKHAFNFNDSVVADLIRRYMKTANSYGITSASDMTPYLGLDMSHYEVFKKLAKDGELTIRVSAARDLFEDAGIFLQMKEETDALGTGMYKVSYFKQFVDGVPGNYTALMLDDYCDKPGNKGRALLPLDKLDAAVKTANKNGIPVRLHACGDGAVRRSLDAFEKAGCGKSLVRNQIEHIEVTTEEDIPRFAGLGVIASVQPEHIVSGSCSHENNCYPKILGAERERYTWPFKSLLEKGATLAFGSDMPVVPGSPFEGIYSGLCRLHNDGTPPGGWNPDERLSIRELIDGYTSGASFAENKENLLGTLEAGKLADVAVFDTNLLTSAPDEIRAAKAVMTIVNGEVVFERRPNRGHSRLR